MPERITVECPTCQQQVPLGILGQVVGWHPIPGTGGRRKGCPGEGTPVPGPEPLEESRG